MQLIKPTTVTNAMLLSSSIAENDHPEHSMLTTYGLGARVILSSTHRIYESLANGNLGNFPDSSPTLWNDVAPTNKWAMFDEVVGTLSESPTSITVVLNTVIASTALALLDVHGQSVEVSVSFAGSIVYTRKVPLTDGSGTSDWFSYFYTPATARTAVILRDLPAYVGALVTVTVHSNLRPASVGTCILGSLMTIGATKYGASVGIQDYSRKGRDDFGNLIVIERAFNKRGRFSVEVPNHRIDYVHTLLASLRATPVLYLGTDSFESTYIYGFYKEFDIVISYPTYSDMSLEIEGLI